MKGLTILTILSAIVGFVAADGSSVSLTEIHQSRCVGKDGVFLPIPESCSQYLICINGIAVLSSCGANHFDARRSICDLPAKAGCISFGPLPLPSNICSGHMDGEKFPVPDDTSKFFECMQETPFLQSCGSLQFDATTKQCVNIPKQEVTPCFGVANGVKLPVDGDSRRYYFCMHNKAFLKDCGHMHFDVKQSACALLVEKESPTIEAQKQEYDALAHKMCQNQRIGARIAMPGTCSEYYVCMGSTGIPKSCNLMQFNPITASCDLPSNVRCSVLATGVVYGAHDIPLRPSFEISAIDQVCHGQRDGIFLAAPGKCSEFYFCFRSKSYLKSCGKRHFSPITLSCVELEESNCMEITPAVQVPVVLANSCLSRDSGTLMRHPTECGKYLICDNHVPVEMLCPAGLHFNPERNYCDWPEMAKCF